MALSTSECQTLLAKLKTAYESLILGEKEIEVKYKDRTVKYVAADMDRLEQRIMMLENQCGCKRNGRLPPVRVRYGHGC